MIKCVGKRQRCSSEDPHPWSNDSLAGRLSACGSHPWGARSPIPTPGSPAQGPTLGRQTSKESGLKTSGAYVQEHQRAVGSQDSAPKGACKYTLTPSPSTEETV